MRQCARGIFRSASIYGDLKYPEEEVNSANFMVFTMTTLGHLWIINENDYFNRHPHLSKIVLAVHTIWMGINTYTLYINQKQDPQSNSPQSIFLLIWQNSSRLFAVTRIALIAFDYRKQPLHFAATALTIAFDFIETDTSLTSTHQFSVKKISYLFAKVFLTFCGATWKEKVIHGITIYYLLKRANKSNVNEIQTHLETLNLPADTTLDQLKTFWKTRVRIIHPDKPGGDKDLFILENNAYENLLKLLSP